MMKRLLVPAALATVIGSLVFAGCGGSSSSNNNPPGGSDAGGSNPDGGGATTMPSDGGGGVKSLDGASVSDGNTNPPLPDGAVLPSGSQLVPSPGASIILDGVTSDDFVIYTDASANAVFALSLVAGSKPISLGTVDANNDVGVTGRVVLIGTSGTNGVGPVSIWTSTAAAPVPLATSSGSFLNFGYYAVSADNKYVAYYEGVDSGGNAGTLTVAGTDASGKTSLVTSVDLQGVLCFPYLAFGGDSLAAGYCTTGGDAGTVDAGLPDGGFNANVASVGSFTAPSWTAVSLATGVQSGIAVDPAGTKVIVVGPAGTTEYPIGGGAAVGIDPNGEEGAATGAPGVFTSDGAHLVYTTTAQALMRATTPPPPAPTQLVASGFADVYALSGDQNWVIGALNIAQNFDSDLYVASATTAGTATTLTSLTTGNILGDPFTADSTHVLFFTVLSHGAGTFEAVAPGAASTPTVLGTGATMNLATSAAKVVFTAHYDATYQVADLLAADTATTAAPTVLVSVADPAFYLNKAKTTILYTWSYQTGANAGLWSIPAP